MKKELLLLSAVLVSGLGFAQSRLSVADYVLAMPNQLRLVDQALLKTWLGDPKKSEVKTTGCATVTKDLKNEYMELFYGGCEEGSGDGDYFSFAVWRSPNSSTVVIGALNYVDAASKFGNRLSLSKTTNGRQFTDVTSKILPMTALQNVFKQCKADIGNIGYKIPQTGTSLGVTELNGKLSYSLDWNNKTQVFVLGKGKCQ